MRFAALALTASLVVLVAGPAAAHPGITGYSGKPYNGVSETCTTNCHAKGGAAPTLTITVPASVVAGSTNAVKVVVAGNKTRTSFNAAFSDGVKTVKGTNTDTPLPKEEPTEIAAKVPPPNGATGTYDFTFIAPPSAGTITMWVAGMAASGNGTSGDGVANAVRTITVTGGTTDAGTDGGGSTDAGGTDAGARTDAATEPPSSADAGATTSGSDPPSGSEGAPAESGGCAVSTPSAAPGGIALVVTGALVALRLRRRRGAAR